MKKAPRRKGGKPSGGPGRERVVRSGGGERRAADSTDLPLIVT